MLIFLMLMAGVDQYGFEDINTGTQFDPGF